MALTSLPTWDGTPFTLATGWSWALAAQDAEGRALGAKLAEYLVDSQFMGAWALAAGYLPPREDVLQTWEDGELRNTLQQISSSAQLMPASDLVSSVGPRLAQAVVKVLRAENDPETAAQSLINHINQP
jgi:ABC-type glycerol-3-phosphate transport system substrate-binding protein